MEHKLKKEIDAIAADIVIMTRRFYKSDDFDEQLEIVEKQESLTRRLRKLKKMKK